MKAITNLAISNDKKNKSRSILVIISIFMTTLLLMTIATLGYGLVKMNKENAGNYYGEYCGSFKGVTMSQLQKMELRGEFDKIGKMAVLGSVESEASASLCQLDENLIQMIHLKKELKEGSFPRNEKEIAAKPGFFKMLGIENPKVGEEVMVSYRVDLKTSYVQDKFIISGLLKEEADSQESGYAAYISKEYYEKKTAEENRRYKAYFMLDSSVEINADNGEEVIKELAQKCGVDERYAEDNYLYLMWAYDPGTQTIVFCILLISAVILFSSVVIYNIFQVGIVQKIQEYGKIKAIGTTKKQMKSLIWKEGMCLAVIGVPLGTVAGFLTAKVSFYAINQLAGSVNKGVESVKTELFSPAIAVFVMILGFLTVWISLKKPIKIVSEISVIEAMRYQENGGKKGYRKGRKNLGVLELTLANLSAHKKRTCSTIITMGLSCVLFVVMANFAGNMDAEYDARKSVEFGEIELSLDYHIGDTAYPEKNLDSIILENPLGEDLKKKIQELEGVKEVRSRNILMLKDEEGYDTVEVLDKETFEREKELGGVIGEFTYEEASEHDSLLFGWSHFMQDYGVSVGMRKEAALSNGLEEVSYIGKVIGSFGNLDTDWAITEDTYKKLGYQMPSAYVLWIDCEDGKEDEVEAAVDDLLIGKEMVDKTLYRDALKTSESSIWLMKVGTYALAALIAVISFMNMANTLITGIVTRKQEFGMLQAIGMTNAQLNKSLQMEGIIFTIGTVFISMLAGIPLGYGLFSYGKSQSWIGLYEYAFPVKEIIIMIGFLSVFQIALSLILSKNIKKESLIDRIRYQG